MAECMYVWVTVHYPVLLILFVVMSIHPFNPRYSYKGMKRRSASKTYTPYRGSAVTGVDQPHLTAAIRSIIALAIITSGRDGRMEGRLASQQRRPAD